VSLVNSFKKVLVANFVEIARTDDETAEPTPEKPDKKDRAAAAAAAALVQAPARDVPAPAPAPIPARVPPTAPPVGPARIPAPTPQATPARMPELALRPPDRGASPAATPARMPEIDPFARAAAARREEAEAAFRAAPPAATVPPPLPPPIPDPQVVAAASETTVEIVRPPAGVAAVDSTPVSAPASVPAKEPPAEPLSLVREDGTVDYDRIFAQAELPTNIPFTAEQALSMLMDLPTDLPLRIKRLTVKATLDAVGHAVGATPAAIVADAERKRNALEGYLADLSVQTSAIREEKEAAIARLRAQIIAAETAHDQATIGTRARIEEFEQVVGFFNIADVRPVEYHQEAYEESVPEEGEVPTFANEEAVRRLLGLQTEVEA
jgi:hypothetical protein